MKSQLKPTIAVIGGGAAGVFAAIHASYNGRYKVVVFERSSKLLSKVKFQVVGVVMLRMLALTMVCWLLIIHVASVN